MHNLYIHVYIYTRDVLFYTVMASELAQNNYFNEEKLSSRSRYKK